MSSKGTSWTKKQHEYDKKINKRYYYPYESLLKKLWKMKNSNDPEYAKAREEYNAKKAERRQKVMSKANEDVNKLQRSTYDEQAKVKNYTLINKHADDVTLKDEVISQLASTKKMTEKAISKGKKLFNNIINKMRK